jgi:hypothetical protein
MAIILWHRPLLTLRLVWSMFAGHAVTGITEQGEADHADRLYRFRTVVTYLRLST